jgi:hypothetical protein
VQGLQFPQGKPVVRRGRHVAAQGTVRAEILAASRPEDRRHDGARRVAGLPRRVGAVNGARSLLAARAPRAPGVRAVFQISHSPVAQKEGHRKNEANRHRDERGASNLLRSSFRGRCSRTTLFEVGWIQGCGCTGHRFERGDAGSAFPKRILRRCAGFTLGGTECTVPLHRQDRRQPRPTVAGLRGAWAGERARSSGRPGLCARLLNIEGERSRSDCA